MKRQRTYWIDVGSPAASIHSETFESVSDRGAVRRLLRVFRETTHDLEGPYIGRVARWDTKADAPCLPLRTVKVGDWGSY